MRRLVRLLEASMKPAPIALFVVTLAVALAWPLSSAIGAAKARAAGPDTDIQAVGCVPDASGDAQAEEPALPPGHPPIQDLLPPGHPPISSGAPALPPGHPPVRSGHPAAPALPLPFEAPAVLSI